MSEKLILDDWAKGLLADPLDKTPLTEKAGELISSYGRKYPVVDGVADLRLFRACVTRDQKKWEKGQLEYEALSLAAVSEDAVPSKEHEASIEEVYREIPIDADCLDVGGHIGRLRVYLPPSTKYLTCDPLLAAFGGLGKRRNLLKRYPVLAAPVNFVCCDAEFLPFRAGSFRNVHMRSVVDHFWNPELAMHEAYRVLVPGGSLIVGLYVRGGRTGRVGIGRGMKEGVKKLSAALGVNLHQDHHVWHPTYKELSALLEICGFKISKVHWQKGHSDSVCYIRAIKTDGVTRVPYKWPQADE